MSRIDTYDFVNTLQAGSQKKSYVLKTCLQSLERSLEEEDIFNSDSITFYQQWKYLHPQLFDFREHGQYKQNPTLIFERFDEIVVAFPSVTTFSLAPGLYTAQQLSKSVNEFLETSLTDWNISFSLTSNNEIQFSFGVVAASGIPGQQEYASRTVYSYKPPDLPLPININPIFYDFYNISSWGLNSLTSQIPIGGGFIRGEDPLQSVSNLIAPEKLVVPYQSIQPGTGKILSTFYASIPHNSPWVEGCLAVNGNFVIGGSENEIVVSTGGLVDTPVQDTLVTSASLCILIGMSILVIYYHNNIYLRGLALVSIVLSVVSLLKQNSDTTAFQEDSSKIWSSTGRLLYTPPSFPLGLNYSQQKLILKELLQT